MAKQSELPTAPAVDLENGSFSNSVNRVFESMQVIVNPAAEISKEELADANFTNTSVHNGFLPTLEAFDAFHRNEAVEDPNLSPKNLAATEAIETTVMADISDLALGYMSEVYAAKGISPDSSAYIKSLLDFGQVMAPEISLESFQSLVETVHNQVTPKIHAELEAQGLPVERSASLKQAEINNGITEAKNPSEYNLTLSA